MGADLENVAFLQIPPESIMSVEKKASSDIEAPPVVVIQYLPQDVVTATIAPPIIVEAEAERRLTFRQAWGWRLALIAIMAMSPAFRNTMATSYHNVFYWIIAVMLIMVAIIRLFYRFPAVVALLVLLLFVLNVTTAFFVMFSLVQILTYEFTHAFCVKALESLPSWKSLRAPPLWATFVDFYMAMFVWMWSWGMMGRRASVISGPKGPYLMFTGSVCTSFAIAAIVCLTHLAIGVRNRRRRALQVQELELSAVPQQETGMWPPQGSGLISVPRQEMVVVGIPVPV